MLRRKAAIFFAYPVILEKRAVAAIIKPPPAICQMPDCNAGPFLSFKPPAKIITPQSSHRPPPINVNFVISSKVELSNAIVKTSFFISLCQTSIKLENLTRIDPLFLLALRYQKNVSFDILAKHLYRKVLYPRKM